MTVVEFLQRKNEIIRDATGISLVPDNQIQKYEHDGFLSMKNDQYACPYCDMFFSNNCIGCPMDTAGNNCTNEYSTYNQVIDVINRIEKAETITSFRVIKKRLAHLIGQYNAEVDGDEEDI